MDIFLINTYSADNVSPELLEKFGHKKISDLKKKKVHCFSYLMTDRILKEVYKINNRELEFIKGKPYLITREKYLSISHSGKYILIAFSDNECGADTEQIKNRDYKSIAKRMNFNASDLDEFYEEWTKYEAQYKLGEKYSAIFQTKFENYMICCLSTNINENFEIYIQNGDNFSNI